MNWEKRIGRTNVYVTGVGFGIRLADGQYSAESDSLSDDEVCEIIDNALDSLSYSNFEKIALNWLSNIGEEIIFNKIYPNIKDADWFKEMLIREEIKNIIDGDI